jgi:hypothetical protein
MSPIYSIGNTGTAANLPHQQKYQNTSSHMHPVEKGTNNGQKIA